MKPHDHISQMWQGLREIINRTYAESDRDESKNALRDYAEDISWSDDLEKLLSEETHNEKQHRGQRSMRGFSTQDAAKLILCTNVLRGSELSTMPSALTFIQFRATAAEANLIGYLIRDFVTPEWRALVEAYDYSDLMKQAEVSA